MQTANNYRYLRINFNQHNKAKLTVGENVALSYVNNIIFKLGIYMAGTNLLTLLDDITVLLDDIATMSKVAT